jgi:transposase
VLSDTAWSGIEPHIIGDERSRGTSGRDNRMFVEGVLWIVRTGSPWRDLSEVFGDWNNVFRWFSRWRGARRDRRNPLSGPWAHPGDYARTSVSYEFVTIRYIQPSMISHLSKAKLNRKQTPISRTVVTCKCIFISTISD